VRVGDSVRVHVNAVADRLFEGKIAAVVPAANLKARTFPVRIRVPNLLVNDSPVLKSGMLCSATLQVGEKRDAILAPKDSLVLGATGSGLFIVDRDEADKPEATVKFVPVRLGVVVDGKVQVVGPLKPTDYVVTLGNERLQPNSPVRIGTVGKGTIESSDSNLPSTRGEAAR
jgi:multidrug efflux pump subunit AcrA (membrane-fusion protein)